MPGQIVGKAKLKDILTTTQYFWGPVEDIAGQELDVLERNDRGDCLCVVYEKGEERKGKGIVDVDSHDIVSFRKVLTTAEIVRALIGTR